MVFTARAALVGIRAECNNITVYYIVYDTFLFITTPPPRAFRVTNIVHFWVYSKFRQSAILSSPVIW